MNKVVEFLNANPVQYLATVGRDGKAKCRPFMFAGELDGKLWFCTNNQKDVYKDMQENPEVEISVSSPDYAWIRLHGKAVFENNMAAKEMCIRNPIVKGQYAGVELRLACAELMEQQGHPEPTGQAKITPAFNLPCRYVLHTVGPIIDGRVTKEDKELLASCYRSCLELAAENGLESVAFCCISTGEFHFPNDLAAEIAVRTVKEFLKKQTSVKKVIFNVFKDLDKAIYEKQL